MANNTSDSDLRDKRRKLCGILTLIFAGCFAVFSFVDAFFFWVFLGATVYSGFLYFYFKPLHDDPYISFDPTGTFKPGSFSFGSLGRINRKLLVVLVAGGFILIVLLVRVFVSASGPADGNQAEPSLIVSTPIDDGDVTATLDKGLAAYNANNYDSAMVYYDQVLQRQPGNSAAIYNKALIYYSQNAFQRSLSLLRADLDNVVQDGNSAWLLGDNYFELKKNDSALLYFNIAHDRGIKDVKFLELLAGLYETSDKGKSIQLYQEILDHDSSREDISKKISALKN